MSECRQEENGCVGPGVRQCERSGSGKPSMVFRMSVAVVYWSIETPAGIAII